MLEVRRWYEGASWFVCGLMALSGCRSESTGAGESPREVAGAASAAAAGVLLAGEFAAAARGGRGRAEIVRQGNDYALRLVGVRIEAGGPVRVYLVGAERASTTRSVVEAEQKYDLAALDPRLDEQLIPLPSAPDPALRSVVLWEPRYGVNLAYAALGTQER